MKSSDIQVGQDYCYLRGNAKHGLIEQHWYVKRVRVLAVGVDEPQPTTYRFSGIIKKGVHIEFLHEDGSFTEKRERRYVRPQAIKRLWMGWPEEVAAYRQRQLDAVEQAKVVRAEKEQSRARTRAMLEDIAKFTGLTCTVEDFASKLVFYTPEAREQFVKLALVAAHRAFEEAIAESFEEFTKLPEEES